MREIRTSGLMSGEGKRNASMPSMRIPRPSSTLPRVSEGARQAWRWGRCEVEGGGTVAAGCDRCGRRWRFARGAWAGRQRPRGLRSGGHQRCGDVTEEAASGQAAAKARRTREAVSMTRAPSFNSRRRMVANSAVARACGGDGVAHGEHQPIGGGVQDEPHLVGERAAAAGAVGGELGLVQLDQVLGLAAGAVERLVDMLGRCRSGGW